MDHGRRNAEYLVLGGLLIFRAVSMVVLMPAQWPDPAVVRYSLIAAVSNAVLAVLAVLVAPRAAPWVVDAIVMASAFVGFSSLQVIDAPERHMFVGYAALLLAVYVAYFRPGRAYAIDVGVILLAYSASVIWAGILHVAYLAAIDLTILVVSATVYILVRRLRGQARSDALTGVLNRHGLMQIAGLVRAQADREREPVAVALVDLDEFKKFNDTHGHVAGDALLVRIVSELVAGLRQVDQVCRYGGDEFAILMPGATVSQASAALSRIQSEGAGGWSFGVAEWAPGSTLDETLSVADVDLYRAKPNRPRVDR